MNFRIIRETEDLKTDVLLYRDTEEDNAFPIVVVTAWLPEDDSENACEDNFSEVYTFTNAEAAKCFIKDYSPLSAKAFVERQQS